MKHYTNEALIEAIQGSNGNLSLIAKKLNCSWATAQKYISQDTELSELFQGENEAMLDKAEDIVNQALDNNEEPKTQLETAKWLLAVKGRSRGYGIKPTREHKNALLDETDMMIEMIRHSR